MGSLSNCNWLAGAPGLAGRLTPEPYPACPGESESPTVIPAPETFPRITCRMASATDELGMGTLLWPGGGGAGAAEGASRTIFGFSSVWICGGGGGGAIATCGRTLLGCSLAAVSSLGGSGRGTAGVGFGAVI